MKITCSSQVQTNLFKSQISVINFAYFGYCLKKAHNLKYSSLLSLREGLLTITGQHQGTESTWVVLS